MRLLFIRQAHASGPSRLHALASRRRPMCMRAPSHRVFELDLLRNCATQALFQLGKAILPPVAHLIGPWCTVSGGDGGAGTRLEKAPASSPAARRKKYASPCDGRSQRAPSVGDDEPGLSATDLQGPVIPVFAHTLVGCWRCIQLCLFWTAHNAHTTL